MKSKNKPVFQSTLAKNAFQVKVHALGQTGPLSESALEQSVSIELNSQPVTNSFNPNDAMPKFQSNQSPTNILENHQKVKSVYNSYAFDSADKVKEFRGEKESSLEEKAKNKEFIESKEFIGAKEQEIEEDDEEAGNPTAVGKSSREMKRLGTSSNLLEDEYFGEDTEKKKAKRDMYINPDAFNKLRDHHVQWDTAVFFEFFLYHILFYLVVGPMLNLIFYKRMNLMRNLQFWGLGRTFIIQTIIYSFNVLIITLYFTLESQNIFLVEIIFTFIIIILRSYVIACKYATLHPDKIKLYRDYYIDPDQTYPDYYLRNWVTQDAFTLYREIYNALQRGEFDPSMFYLAFFVEPSDEVRKQLIQINDQISVHHKYTSSVYQPDCLFEEKSSSQFYGYSILGYIIGKFIGENKSGGQIIRSIIIALMRTAVPIVYRYVYREKFEFSAVEILQLVALSLNTIFGYMTSFLFLFFFIRDMRMKNYILTQCKLILQVKKVDMSEKKILPTIDIVNANSLKAWSILRRVCLDYGKQYSLRMQAYMTVYLFSILITSALLMLWVIKVYELDNIYPVMCLFELLITFSTLLYILFWGSMVNESFPAFKNTLGDHKVLFQDLLRMRSIYFKMRVEEMKSNNFVVRKSILKIKQEIGLAENEYDDAKVENHLTQILSGIDDCEFELEQDFRTQPFTIFGIKFNLDIFKQICVAVFTIAMGAVQVYLFINGKISTASK